MKILQVNCVYGKGSTGKIVADIHHELMQRGIESVVCYGRGAKVAEKNVYKTCGEFYAKLNNLWSRVTGIMYGGCALSTARLIAMIRREKPDIVHLHCINGYFVNIYRIVGWLKKQNIRTALTLHAEFMYTGNCGHALECERWRDGCGHCPRWRQETKSWFFDRTAHSWKRIKRAFDGFENLVVTSVSPWLMERAKCSPVFANKRHAVVLNGLDTDIFHAYDTEDLRARHNVMDAKVVFHATPNFTGDPNHLKGGYYILRLAEMMKNENVKFFVAGNHEPGMEVPPNVVLLGRIEDQRELARYYSMADVTVLTSRKETFSMVVAESLCCGTPVVGFRAGGPEEIALPEYSEFVEYGDCEQLYKATSTCLYASKPNYISEVAKKKYSGKEMCGVYISVYKSVLQEG